MALTMSGCAASSRVLKTYEDPQYASTPIANVLVIAQTASYENRSAFERELVKRLESRGPRATAYYTISGNTPLRRDEVVDTVRSGSFDSVLFTRVLDTQIGTAVERGASSMTSTRKSGNPVNLFRYDYEQYAGAETVSLSASAVLATELYLASSESKVWAIESGLAGESNVYQIIATVAEQIVGQLAKDRKIAGAGGSR